jgi:hypothetical protein
MHHLDYQQSEKCFFFNNQTTSQDKFVNSKNVLFLHTEYKKKKVTEANP